MGVLNAARDLTITEEDQQEVEEIAECIEESFEPADGASTVDRDNKSPFEYPIQSEWARRELDDFRRQDRFRRNFWTMMSQQPRDDDGNDDVLVPSPFRQSDISPLLTNTTPANPPREVEPPHWILPQ